MAIQFDTVGKILAGNFNPSGDFSIAIRNVQYKNELCQLFRRRAALNDSIGYDTGGRITASVSNIQLPTLTIPSLTDGAYIAEIKLSMVGTLLTFSASGQTSNATHNGNLIQFQDIGVGFSGIIDEGVMDLVGVGTLSKQFDFSDETGPVLIDLLGNGNATLQDFNTGGFIANVNAPAAQSKLRIETSNNLPLSGEFPVYIIRTDTNELIHYGDADFTNGVAEIFFNVADVPVSTPIHWSFVNGAETLGANKNDNLIGG